MCRIAEDVGAEQRGRGMMQGLAFSEPAIAAEASRRAFELGMIVETSGSEDEVLKLLPPLTISHTELNRGLALLAKAVKEVTQAHEQAETGSLKETAAVA